MLTSGGSTKAITAITAVANTIHWVAGRLPAPPILTNQVEGSTPTGLVKEVEDDVGIELNLVTDALLFVLIVGLNKGPVDEEWAAYDVSPGHKSPVAAVETHGAVVPHGKVSAGWDDQIFTLDVVRQLQRPGRRYVA